MSGSEQNKKEQGNLRSLKVAALKYNADQNAAPVVVAAGSGYVAQKIVEIADEAGISVYHDDTAATLLSGLRLGQEVPPELYQMVVDVYLAVLTASQSIKPPL
ncbi:MAG: EscU/YscU/HrcU family type III secretion system export apparatus switch protein [Oscillospiraceae bacterium]|jgi:flagellar biosynthesis protein